MEEKFFQELKKYLLNEQGEQLKMFIPYYETIVQAKDDIKELIDDAEKYYIEFRYEKDKYDGYTDGEIKVHFYEKDPNSDYGWQSAIDHYYKIELRLDDRMWGYCQCTPQDEGYNPKYDCCGDGCDWTAPQINVTKITGLSYHAFNGEQRELWELERNWNEEKIDHEEELRKAHLERIERQIRDLEEQRKQYIK